VAPGIEFQDNQIPVVDRAGGRLTERSALAKVWSCLKDTYGYDHVAPERFEELQQDVVDLAGAFGNLLPVPWVDSPAG